MLESRRRRVRLRARLAGEWSMISLPILAIAWDHDGPRYVTWLSISWKKTRLDMVASDAVPACWGRAHHAV